MHGSDGLKAPGIELDVRMEVLRIYVDHPFAEISRGSQAPPNPSCKGRDYTPPLMHFGIHPPETQDEP